MNQAGPISRHSDDEIDLRELFFALWAERLKIVAVTLLFGIAAAAYAFLSAPVYEARSSLLPPQLSDIAGYNLGRSAANLSHFKVKDVYQVFTRNLTSEALRRKFFREVYLPSLSESERAKPQDKLWKRFNEKILSARAPDEEEHPDFFEVRVEHKDPELAAAWVNRYVAMSAEQTSKDMQQNVLQEIDIRAREIERRIGVLRESALQRRQDRIVHLKEALVVADTVGLSAPQVTTGRTSSDGELTNFVDGSLMYMRGAKAIRAELQTLESRKTDDPFIEELRELQSQLAFLKGIDVSPDNVSSFTLDSTAEVPETPIKPKKAMVLAIGLGLGLVLGVLFALLSRMFRKEPSQDGR